MSKTRVPAKTISFTGKKGDSFGRELSKIGMPILVQLSDNIMQILVQLSVYIKGLYLPLH